MIEKLQNIANSYAEECTNDAIYPAHLFKAILHKEMGLVSFLEKELNKDYYYLQDWADIQMRLSPLASRPMRDLDLSAESDAVLDEAENYRLKFGMDECNAVCVLAALVTPGVGFSFDQLKTLPLTAGEICTAVGGSEKQAEPVWSARQDDSKPSSSGKGDAIAKYCIEKVRESRDGNSCTVIGFEDEVGRICETMGRMTKANVLVTGEAGVGKTSLVNAFVNHIASDNVPEFMKGISVFELDLALLAADAQYKGEIEDRFKGVVDAVRNMENSILLIESIDKIFDRQGSLYGTSTILKSEIAKGGIRLLCTASIEGFTKNIETDKEILNKVERMIVSAPDDAHCLEILKGAIPAYEKYHNVKVDEEIMEESIRLAKRFMTERSLPDSAFDLLDRGMVHSRSVSTDEKNGDTTLSKDDLYFIISRQTGIPMGKIQTGEKDKLLNAGDILRQRVVGQDYAIGKVLDSVFESRSGLNKKGQPMGSFFFLGPTGTGKTELSKSLAQFLFGDESALIRFDMSEFKEEHSVALLYGAPPGYVGYEEGGLLVNKIRQTPYSVVLFDEIEKAHKSVFDLFLQILDEGKLHDRLGRVGDFSNALLLFTSNIGSQFISESFQKGEIPECNKLMDIMQSYFRPEFLGRLTEIVPFAPISPETVTKIYNIHLNGLVKLLAEQNIKLEVDKDTLEKIAMKGFDPQFGARPIIGNIRKDLRQPLSKMIISGKVVSGDTIVVTSSDDGTPQFQVKGK